MIIEIFKIATPYILAFIVYLVWHVQKEKEVISSEARNLLNLLNNFTNEFRDFEKKLKRKNTQDELSSDDILGDELNNLFDLHDEIFNSIDFISSSVLDVDLFKLSKNYVQAVRKILREYSKCLSNDEYIQCKESLKEDRAILLGETREFKKVVLNHVLFRKKYFISLFWRSLK
ncbi:hypothetical protein [Acinetobacter junii]|uniref:hypothetical protein n=1 Tax=Acinetobacter junii TaxID=40215 RepID=UPI00301819E5